MEKTCPSCRQTKPYEEFGRNRSLKYGLSFYCLACNRARNKIWYQERRRSLGFEVRDYSWIPDGFRWCPSCQQAVAHEDYTRSAATASGFGSRCRACDRAANSEGYFYRKYKLTKRALAELRVAQGDACAICGDAEPQHLDHDHGSGVTRELLCQRCNQGLGLFRDDPRLLRAAAEYVERHRARQAAASVAPANGPAAPTRPGTPPVGSKRRPTRADRSRGSLPYRRGLLMLREADG
jgi:hypothetical protein